MDEFRKFWIRVGEGNANTISVGRGGEEEPFMHHTFTKTRYAVLYTAFSAYYSSSNYWKIKMKDEVKEIRTEGSEFQYYPYYCYNEF